MTAEEELRIKELEKKVEELSFVRGITDKFGTYVSLQKDADIILFFLANPEHKRRYIEVIKNYTGKWSSSTIEAHLHNLTKRGILSKTRLPGEYEIAYNLSNDMDLFVQYLVGASLYNLAKKSWEKKDYHY